MSKLSFLSSPERVFHFCSWLPKYWMASMQDEPGLLQLFIETALELFIVYQAQAFICWWFRCALWNAINSYCLEMLIVLNLIIWQLSKSSALLAKQGWLRSGQIYLFLVHGTMILSFLSLIKNSHHVRGWIYALLWNYSKIVLVMFHCRKIIIFNCITLNKSTKKWISRHMFS